MAWTPRRPPEKVHIYPTKIIGVHRSGSTRTLTREYNHGPVAGMEKYTHQSGKIHMFAGFLVILAGFKWDGASGPTKDRWFSGHKNAVRGPLVHDALYSLIRRLLGPLSTKNRNEYKRLQKVADKEFFKVLKEDRMPWWRRHLWYRMVRWFGWPFLTKGGRE